MANEWDSKHLSQFFIKALNTYKKTHPNINYETLLDSTKAYMASLPRTATQVKIKQPNHIDRYTYLTKRFDNTDSPKLSGSYIKKYEDYDKKYKNILENKFINLSNIKDACHMDIEDAAFKAYMKGDYFYDSDTQTNQIRCKYEDDCGKLQTGLFTITDLNAFYYALVRVIEMPEDLIVMSFYYSDRLDFAMYNQLYVFDVVDYYYQKSGLSASALEKLIDKPGFKSSNISDIVNGTKNITFVQFETLAPFLNIREDLIQPCLYRIAQNYDQYSYGCGYRSAIEDLEDHPDEMAMVSGKCVVDAEYLDNLENAVDDANYIKKLTLELKETQDKLHSYSILHPTPTSTALMDDYIRKAGYTIITLDDSVDITTLEGQVNCLYKDDYLKLLRKAVENVNNTIVKNLYNPNL